MEQTIKESNAVRRLLLLVFSVVVIASVGLAATAQQAFAADETTYDATKVALTKTIDTSTSITTAAEDFVFTFTPVSVNGDPYVGTAGSQNMPVINHTTTSDNQLTLTFTAGQTVKYEDNFLPVVGTTLGINFTHAGEYIYTVVETAPGTHTAGMTYSSASYTLHVYVANNTDGSLIITGATVNKDTNDAGGVVNQKVDPTVPQGGTGSAFNFTNTYTKNSTLKVAKTTTGTSADLTKQFSFDISTLVVPASAGLKADSTLVATKYDSAGAATGDTYTYVTADGVNFNLQTGAKGITLANGEYVLFSSIPVGTTYTVEELELTGLAYTPSAAVIYNSGEAVTQTGTTGTNITVHGDGTGTTVNTTVGESTASNDANKTTITNTYTNPSPTGFLINNAPFIILILVAAAGITLFVVARKRKSVRA